MRGVERRGEARRGEEMLYNKCTLYSASLDIDSRRGQKRREKRKKHGLLVPTTICFWHLWLFVCTSISGRITDC